MHFPSALRVLVAAILLAPFAASGAQAQGATPLPSAPAAAARPPAPTAAKPSISPANPVTAPTVTAAPPDVQLSPKIPCRSPRDLVQLDQPLTRTAVALAAGDPLLIVAIGSSSTWGAGASSQNHSYPARLEAELRAHFPGTPITVLNRGVGGEDARQMLARFDEMVIKERPDLIIWQVGTNAVLRDQSLDGEAPLITEGIRRLKASHADVVLMDPQYAPKVIAKPEAEGMVDLIGRATRNASIGVFHRFAIMRDWVANQGAPIETLFSTDGLHMNDWSYGCVAKLLGNSIVDAIRRPAVARARPRQ